MPSDIAKDGWFLTYQEMMAIRRREYHYNAWSSTLLDPYLQPFWRFVVSFVPKTIAPTTLSLCGLGCNFIAAAITITFAPKMITVLPQWVNILNAVSVFLYQTFDGIDGKQSFQTQNSEIEEYADHAVDSIAVTLNAILLGAAMQLGQSRFWLCTNFALALSAFYAAHWAAYRTNSLVFGHIDVSEAQFSMIGIHIANAVGGDSLWSTAIFGNPPVTIGSAVCMISAFTLLLGTLGNVAIALGLCETPLVSNGIQIPRRPLSSSPLRPYVLIMVGLFCCFQSGLFNIIPVPTMLIVGFSQGKAATQLIFQKLTAKDKAVQDISVLYPLALFVLGSYLKDWEAVLSTSAWTLVVIAAVDVSVFHTQVMLDLKQARKTNIFRMRIIERGELQDKGFYVCGGNIQTVKKAWQEFAVNKKRVKTTYLL